ncbi:hypothetical protein TB2_022441 [Malus domestica]
MSSSNRSLAIFFLRARAVLFLAFLRAFLDGHFFGPTLMTFTAALFVFVATLAFTMLQLVGASSMVKEIRRPARPPCPSLDAAESSLNSGLEDIKWDSKSHDCTSLATRSADGTALGLLPKDCRKQHLKSGGVAVWLIAWFTVLRALGLLPKDC